MQIVQTRVVPWGPNYHPVVYPAPQFFEYMVMSNLLLWMMTRRARALRLHWERTSRNVDRFADLEAARERDRDELDRAAEELARRPVEPLPAAKPVAAAALGAIVEGIDVDVTGATVHISNPVAARAGIAVTPEELRGEPVVVTAAVVTAPDAGATQGEPVQAAGAVVIERPGGALSVAAVEDEL